MSEPASAAERSTGRTGLERSIGLPGALAIGVGTMVGAGIFVFPGLVAERVGSAGILSFVIAGCVALVVAVYTSELATAMPVSGGGYTFIERALGPFAGVVVGLAQWTGLIFAASFYLASFGTYFAELLANLGYPGADWTRHVVPAAAAALTVVNLVGGGRAGALQKYLVIVLTALLTALFVYGLVHLTAGASARDPQTDFDDVRWTGIVTTAAMIFTAYIGFVQIATVGGEIRDPRRNLPRALIGSVVIVLLLYVLVFHVSTLATDRQTLGSYGETAVVEVSRILVGVAGVVAALAAGLLATLSSANASILSSSRTLYALARDGHVPGVFANTWRRYHSPWAATLAVGLPAAALSYLQTRTLAEVASLLHLVVYGLICFSVARLRRTRPEDYRPTFSAPGPSIFALIAGMTCFTLIAFMASASIIAGGAVLAGAALVHVLSRRFLKQ